MSTPFKPAGYNSVSPYFIVPQAQRFIDLMVALFDAQELRRYTMPDGTLMHAELMLDDSVVMLGEASEKFPAVPIVMHVYVPDVDPRTPRPLRWVAKRSKPRNSAKETRTGALHSRTTPATGGA
jgi:uncharacterized glyoxalase superfamily protein PhnB